MISVGETTCPKCGGEVRYYDKVHRVLKTKHGEVTKIVVRRFKCQQCGAVHREMSDRVIPNKRYEADIVEGVREGLITPEVLGFEDFPCEATMKRWKK